MQLESAHLLHRRLIRPPATFLARLPEPNALEAMLEAWLNLSHREKAIVFVTVRTRAITRATVSTPFHHRHATKAQPRSAPPLTNKRQPERRHLSEADELYEGDDAEQDPQRGLGVQRDPEETLVGRVDVPRIRVGRLEHPFCVAGGRVHLIPPAQSHQPSARDVLEVVEVHGEEDHGDDEDQDAVVMS